MMKIRDVTPRNIRNFVEGNSHFYLRSNQDVREQAEYRAHLCRSCVKNRKCPHCPCRVPNLFFAPNKQDGAHRWGKMMSRPQWRSFKATQPYQDFIKLKQNGYNPLNPETHHLASAHVGSKSTSNNSTHPDRGNNISPTRDSSSTSDST